jgi:Helix-turn-helix domain
MSQQSHYADASRASPAAVLADYLPETTAADEIEHTPRTMRKWRQRGEGPAYVKVGRKVYYARSALIDWLRRQEVKPIRSRGAR